MHINKNFIKDDPVQFIHRFKNKNDIEIAGFIASMFSYGKREVFIQKLNYIFSLMNNKPYDYIKNFDYKDNNIKDCDYRFSKNCDLVQIMKILNGLYKENETIESMFRYGYSVQKDVWGMFQTVEGRLPPADRTVPGMPELLQHQEKPGRIRFRDRQGPFHDPYWRDAWP